MIIFSNEKYFGTLPLVKLEERIDRTNWNYNFESRLFSLLEVFLLKNTDLWQVLAINLENYHDAHILHPLEDADNWERTLPLLRIMFNSSDVEW